MGEQKTLVVGNGKTLLAQWGEYVEAVEGDAIAQSAEVLFAGALSPLGLIFRGINPLRFEVGMGWQSAALTPDKQGVILTAQPDETEPARTLRVQFDPKTHLITRAHYEGLAPAEDGKTPSTYSGTVTLTARPAKFASDRFEFSLPAGQTLESMAPPFRHDPRLVAGATPFALAGQTLAGKAISLDDYNGKVVLLDFWATWCGPCVEEIPMMRATYRKYHDQGFEIIGISSDEDASDLRTFLQKRGLPWPQILDEDLGENSNGVTYGVKGIPFTLLIGKDGKIVASDLRGWHLPLAVEKALQAPAP